MHTLYVHGLHCCLEPVSACWLGITRALSLPCPRPLQLLAPQALADLTGTAARCTAFAVYSKAQRQVQPDSLLEEMALEPGEALPAPLPLCSQPLMVLASAAAAARHSVQDMQQPAAAGQHQQEGSEAGVQQYALHCCYAQPPTGSSLLPLFFTDSCGELVHAELLDSSACGHGLGSSSSAAAAGGSGRRKSSGDGSGTPAGVACRLVLQRCVELLASLRAAGGPSKLLQGIVVSAVGMQPAERTAWQQLLERDALQLTGLPEGCQVSVVELRTLPPARCAAVLCGAAKAPSRWWRVGSAALLCLRGCRFTSSPSARW